MKQQQRHHFLLTFFIFCFMTEEAVTTTGTSNSLHRIHRAHRIRRIVSHNSYSSSSSTGSVENDNLKTIFVDAGTNYTLPCNGQSAITARTESREVWRWEITLDNHDRTKSANTVMQEDGSLFFTRLTQSDSGIYSCCLESSSDDKDKSDGEDEDYRLKQLQQKPSGFTRNIISHSSSSFNGNSNPHSNSNKHGRGQLGPSPSTSNNSSSKVETSGTRVRLKVRTAPLLLKNVTVLPSTVLASVMWEEPEDDGGYPILSFQIRYRLENDSVEDWKTCQPNFISPDKRHVDIFHLQPSSTYIFEMWANNHLGKGYSTVVQVSTHNDIQEIEGKYLLEGVDTFDTRAWIVAVLVVLGTLLILGLATCFLFYKEYYLVSAESRRGDLDGESIELMPNIILNPAYEFQSMELLEPDENLNDTTPLRVNNNSVIFPTRV